MESFQSQKKRAGMEDELPKWALATARKTLVETKHLHDCDCFTIMPSCLNSHVGKVRYNLTGVRSAELNREDEIFNVMCSNCHEILTEMC